jgi:hypothetical protein
MHDQPGPDTPRLSGVAVRKDGLEIRDGPHAARMQQAVDPWEALAGERRRPDGGALGEHRVGRASLPKLERRRPRPGGHGVVDPER